MRFLLLCTAVFVLFAASAKTESDDDNDPTDPPTETTPTDSPVETTTDSDGDEPLDTTPFPVTSKPTASDDNFESPSRKVVRRLQKKIDKKREAIKALNEQFKIVVANLESAHSEVSKSEQKRKELASELKTTRRKLRSAQDKLKKLKKCSPSQSELDKLIDEEFRKQVEARNEESKRFYAQKYKTLLEDLREGIIRELRRIEHRPHSLFPSNLNPDLKSSHIQQDPASQ